MLTETELRSIRVQYYSHPYTKYNLCTQLKNRELAILTPKGRTPNIRIRYLKAFHSSFLDKHFKRFGIYTNIWTNLYNSLSQFKWIPTLSYNIKERNIDSDSDYARFSDDYEKHIIAYDILFDLDASAWIDAYNDAKIMKSILDEKKIGYYIFHSGNKGFHIRIPFEYTGLKPDRFDVDFKCKIADFIYYFKQVYNLQTIDDSIVDLKRIAKLPYSLVEDRVILPLSDEQFNNFKIEMIKLENNPPESLMNRGILLRSHNLNQEQLCENFQKLFKELS